MPKAKSARGRGSRSRGKRKSPIGLDAEECLPCLEASPQDGSLGRGGGSSNLRKRKSPAKPSPDVNGEEYLPSFTDSPQFGSSARGGGSSNLRKRKSPAKPSPGVNGEEYLPSFTDSPQFGSSARGRGSRSRNKRNPPSRPMPSFDVEECPPRPETARQRGRSGRRRSRNARRPRPTVINLDFTFSSDEFEDEHGSNENLSSPEVTPKRPFNLSLIPSPTLDESIIQSNSDDECLVVKPTEVTVEKELDDECLVVKPSEVTVEKEPSEVTVEKEPSEVTVEKEPDEGSVMYSDSDEDLFSIDYSSRRDMALKSAFKEISKLEKEEKEEPATIDQSDDCISIEGSPVLNQDGESLHVLSESLNLSLPCSPVKLTKRSRIITSKKITQAKKHLKKVYEEMSKNQANDSFGGDITILSDKSDDDEENENSSITLLVKWESNYLRWPVRKYQKFSSVYQEVADRFSLNVAQVLLCHNDKVISPEVCPKDLNLNIGDIIEGGVQSQPTLKVKNTVVTHSPDSIPVKIQSSDRKGTVTIYIRRHDKMIELMHRYAEEKNLKIENLRFSFDGETLDPSDTPETLDLEGNECIDVFAK